MSATVHDDRGWRGVVDHEPPRTLFDAAEDARTLDDETIEARFVAFHAAHPEVFAKLVEFSLELLHAGYEHFGVGLVWERLRYESMVGHRPDEGSPWRLNNSFRSRYARLIADQVPALADVFTTRALRAARPPRERRMAGECSACADGHCRSCSDSGCQHECDLAVLL